MPARLKDEIQEWQSGGEDCLEDEVRFQLPSGKENDGCRPLGLKGSFCGRSTTEMAQHQTIQAQVMLDDWLFCNHTRSRHPIRLFTS